MMETLVRLRRAMGGRAAALAGPTTVWLAASIFAAPVIAQQPPVGAASGLPLPRFVSLKSDPVNMRRGPGVDYPTVWVYRRAGLPLEIVAESEGWRQVRDAEGTTGWIVQAMLSGRRTALVLPWELKPGIAPPQVELRADDNSSSATLAIVEAGVIANVRTCDGRWCRVSVGELRGFIEQKKLWGVREGEVVR